MLVMPPWRAVSSLMASDRSEMSTAVTRASGMHAAIITPARVPQPATRMSMSARARSSGK